MSKEVEDNPGYSRLLLRAEPLLMSLEKGAIVSSAPGEEPRLQKEKGKCHPQCERHGTLQLNTHLTQKPSALDAVNRDGPSSQALVDHKFSEMAENYIFLSPPSAWNGTQPL